LAPEVALVEEDVRHVMIAGIDDQSLDPPDAMCRREASLRSTSRLPGQAGHRSTQRTQTHSLNGRARTGRTQRTHRYTRGTPPPAS
jgi:hypothetical protein